MTTTIETNNTTEAKDLEHDSMQAIAFEKLQSAHLINNEILEQSNFIFASNQDVSRLNFILSRIKLVHETEVSQDKQKYPNADARKAAVIAAIDADPEYQEILDRIQEINKSTTQASHKIEHLKRQLELVKMEITLLTALIR